MEREDTLPVGSLFLAVYPVSLRSLKESRCVALGRAHEDFGLFRFLEVDPREFSEVVGLRLPSYEIRGGG